MFLPQSAKIKGGKIITVQIQAEGQKLSVQNSIGGKFQDHKKEVQPCLYSSTQNEDQRTFTSLIFSCLKNVPFSTASCVLLLCMYSLQTVLSGEMNKPYSGWLVVL